MVAEHVLVQTDLKCIVRICRHVLKLGNYHRMEDGAHLGPGVSVQILATGAFVCDVGFAMILSRKMVV